MQACSDFNAELARFIGVPFISRGRDAARGFDCWGLVRAASLALFGRELPDYPGYSDARQVCDVAPLFDVRSDWHAVQLGDETAGDVIVLRIAGHVTHAGLVIRRSQMLHTMLYCNSCIEAYSAAKWRHRVEGFYRWQPR